MQRSLKALTVTVTVMVSLAGLVPIAEGYKGPAHTHKSWVKHTVLEQFNITATEVRVRMRYSQDSTRVYSPAIDYFPCYTSSFPGWTVVTSFPHIVNNQSYSLSTHGHCEFHWAARLIDYYQHAYTVAFNTDFVNFGCGFLHGTLPPGWESHCVGGRGSGDF
ncbi:MAG TPA: hypothetical protein VNO79_08375 [Actinomycetota bacterium]|nr:hypothetical protein [Actinomycetota bacterium]